MNSSTKNTSVSVAEIQASTTALQSLLGTMPFLIKLTPAERRERRGNRLGPKTWRVLENRVAAARQNRNLLPPAFDLRQFERDTELTGALQQCLSAVDQIREAVQDTLLAVGGRAVQAGALAYGHIRVSAAGADQLKRTVNKLASRVVRARPEAPAAPAAASDSTPPVEANRPAV